MRRNRFVFAAVASMAVHALAVFMAVQYAQVHNSKPVVAPPREQVIRLEVVVIPSPAKPDGGSADQPGAQAPATKSTLSPAVGLRPSPESIAKSLAADRPLAPLASMDAPPAPTAQEWAMAANYTLKNSKRYRHTWGQQVRSLMGTAFEGPEQGTVRFRIEIAPNGSLSRLDTLWTTSAVVEQRARTAVEAMPALPPTPNGKPLIFEKTIVFDAFTAESPPLYKNDCEPDPLQHGNRFVWDGRLPQRTADEPVVEKLDPVAYAECLKQLPQDSIEAEAASDERQLKQWGSPTLGR
jgi:hypothetical protein